MQHDSQGLAQILNSMQQQQRLNGPASVQLRKDRLQRACNLIKDNHRALAEAISNDFGHRSTYQSQVADLITTTKMLQHAIEHVEQWMEPEQVSAPDPAMQTRIEHQPLGVVGIISPWNFPVNLAFGPLAGIFAAGNTAMLKPSELTPSTSQLMAELVAKYFGPDELCVVLGEADVARTFSALPFDHLVFTGSTQVGRHVMRAAAENLVPVTLELGGKSPVLIGQQADLAKAVSRTLTIKTFNAGQICLSPDYVLMPTSWQQDFNDQAQEFVRQIFPAVQQNPDYTAIINDNHFDRLIGLLDDARAKGADIVSLAPDNEPAYDRQSRKIAPHLVFNVSDDMQIMQEEIFGPLLPVKTFTDEQDAIDYINSRPRPLAAYLFSEDPERQRNFALQTTSGGLVINDVMTHVSIDDLPFGGVGQSGMGAYHGKFGFTQFTHAKPVVVQSEAGTSNLRLRAPYADKQSAVNAFFE